LQYDIFYKFFNPVNSDSDYSSKLACSNLESIISKSIKFEWKISIN